MPDREKVIKALEICEKKDCVLCPYTDWCGEYDDSYYDCTKLLAKDARALLKQEAVEPIITPWAEDEDGNIVVAKRECGTCGCQFFTERPNFCENCGTPILWEGR